MGLLNERLDIENIVNSLQASAAERPMLIIPYIAEINDRELYKNAGYTSFYKYCAERLGVGETQVKNSNKVFRYYGRKTEEGEYFIPEEYIPFGIEKLNEITKIPDFNHDNPMDTIVQYGLTAETTMPEVKRIVAEAKGKDIKPDLKGIQAICEKLEIIDNTLRVIGIWGHNENISDKDFRRKAVDTIEAIRNL